MRSAGLILAAWGLGAVLCALAGCGTLECGAPELAVDGIAKSGGLYVLEVGSRGAWFPTVNGKPAPLERGSFVRAEVGDLIAACNDCGCSLAVPAP